MSRALLPVAQGFEEIELVTLADVLRRAKIEVVLASLTSSLEVSGAHGIVLKADCTLEDIDTLEYRAIALHGGMDGVRNMLNTPLLLELVKDFLANAKFIGAICAAPLVLDKLGLLNQDFCCYPGCENMMKNTQNKRLDLPFKTSGNIITGTGPAFAMPFAIEIVRNLMGEDIASKLKKELLLSK
ncbi:DJ-1 family glyoxalase III [Helicobacter pametensis]|uniref:DJ-1 family glyoxalase III n=1 Tax=Helicobacter pametensis TaxID=95149 RepID=UPI00047F13C3|nr:DJ-1 family glyoxalase III [Helicobacter pametensis]